LNNRHEKQQQKVTISCSYCALKMLLTKVLQIQQSYKLNQSATSATGGGLA